MHKADARVELRKPSDAPFNPCHTDENQVGSTLVENGSHLHSDRLFQWPLQRVILQGYSVPLVPVDYSHLDQLARWSGEEEIWRYMTFAYLASRDELQTWVGSAMRANERGTEMNFAIIDEASQAAVGTTSFYRVVPEHKRLELGKTWLEAPYRRTRINTAAKCLMLNYAFETILANRVELNTDLRNVRYQRAMERIGAARDGVMRFHTIMRDGFVRDTVNYSFTIRDWPATKISFERLLGERTSRVPSKAPHRDADGHDK